MRSLVFGAGGMLGRALVAELRRRSRSVLGLDRSRGDVTDPERVAGWVEAFRPTTVFNCAAFTAVDRCETERETAYAVNEHGVEHVTSAVRRLGGRFVHVSTDYVFDGEGSRPYREDDAVGPRSVYGSSKLAGERIALDLPGALVVRTSWVFGPGGRNFVATIVGLLDQGPEELRVVTDQVGRPTYAPYLARALVELADHEDALGLVHYANRDPVSWLELAREVARERGATTRLVGVSTEEFPRPAPRPAYSVLDTARAEGLLGRATERWSCGLSEYLRTMSGEVVASAPTFRPGKTES